MLEMNTLYNMDCMIGMKEFPDGFFDLAVVDPPYGLDKSSVQGSPTPSIISMLRLRISTVSAV